MTSVKNVDAILGSLQAAQAPPKLTISFLGDLGFKSSSDRLIINVFKALGFLTPDGAPTDRYFRWLNQAEAEAVMAEGLRDAYADLFQLHKHAENLSRTEVRNKFRTLTQGKASDAVLDKMVTTFFALAKHADFDAAPPPAEAVETPAEEAAATPTAPVGVAPVALGGLVYSIKIHLPETRDPAVYDALFRSLKIHLLQ